MSFITKPPNVYKISKLHLALFFNLKKLVKIILILNKITPILVKTILILIIIILKLIKNFNISEKSL